ncbi:hypothetical protein [Streptomyces synnematoformans]|uniref:Uncharacterized protein n=1 Tax=Streptomyces synnematoformans TaxID=415721 RepID=A0ABN2XER1_9ACTN
MNATETAEELTADADVIRTWLGHLYADRPGFVSICSDADGWAGHRFTTDEAGITAATEYAVKLDRRRPKGIYAQTTTLRERPAEGRGGEDLAHALSHLWADGDFGTVGHKPGPDDLPAPPDAEAVAKVVTDSGLPEPSGWAHSGGGLNPIWMLAETHIIGDDEDRARIKELTTGLQAILAAQAYRCGWSWDTEVGNLDRLMKLPGSINRKEGIPRAATIGPGTGDVLDLSMLQGIVAQSAPAARATLQQAAEEKRQRKAARLGRQMPPPRAPRTPREATGGGPLDVLAAMLRFGDVLEPAGFTYQGTHSDGREKWLRPTTNGDRPSSDYSLLCDDHVAINWSERADLPVGAQPPGRKLTIPRLYAELNYGGDASEAARDIMRAAAGHGRGPASQLPYAVLEEVRRRCHTDNGHQGFEAPPPPQEPPPEYMDEPPPEDDPGEPDGVPKPDDEPGDRLPGVFWQTTPALLQIRQMAQARRTSPDAVLHAVLARIAAMAHPSVQIDNGIHQPATLGWYCGLYGPPGSGKGQAENTAEELTPFPETDDLAHIDISTGQGLIAAYLDLETDPDGENGKKKILVQARSRGYALATEGSVLDAMAQMAAAATLNGVLCKSWMSERQGTSNADVERRRVLAKGAYTLSMSLGVQEEPAAKLLEMGSIGLPQRLGWAHATLGPDTPPERPARTGALMVTTRDGGEIQVTTRDGGEIQVTAWVEGLRNTIMSVPEHVTKDLDELALEISFGRGADAPLDTHEPLWRVKCAALLALLHGRRTVTTEDWDLATQMWQTSRKVRDCVSSAAQRRRRAELDALRAEAVQTAVESQSAVYEAVHGAHPSVVNVAKRAHRYLTRHGGEIPARDVHRNTVKKTDRDKFKASGATEPLWPAALQYGAEQGWLAVLADGALLAAGSSAPE